MQGHLAVEAVQQPTSIDDLQPFAGSSSTPFHTSQSQDISIKTIQKYSLLMRNSEMLFLFQVMTQTFLRSYKKLKLNLLNLISSKSQVTQEIAKSTKSQRPFGRNGWRPKRGNFKNNAVIFLEKLKKKCVSQALFVIPAVHQRRMSFVATNAGSIYV